MGGDAAFARARVLRQASEVVERSGVRLFRWKICKPYYAPRMGALSLPPGRYFRMHMIGYFVGIDGERGIMWRCLDK
jgi:hypothetical protein